MEVIQKLYEAYLKFPVISTDTRKIVPRSIFFALKGPNFNANTFAAKALEEGCEYAVVDEKQNAVSDKYFLVDDVLATLQQLARHHRDQLTIPVFALTGSNGKTTTKELICSVLKQKYKVHATTGNLNNHIGVPLTVLGITKEHEIAVVEMGANHIGEIAALCKIADPGLGMITNIGKAHIEGFGSEEGVKIAKSEMYVHLRNKNGIVFVNADDPLLMQLSAGMERKTYGIKHINYLSGYFKNSSPFLELEITEEEKTSEIKTQLVGKYNLPNVLAAAAIGKHFGLNSAEIKKGIESYTPDNNRSQVVKKGSNTLIMDAYNANPSSMKAAIENFAGMEAKNKFFILGDMRELGQMSEDEHKKMVELTQQLNLKGIFAGEEFLKVKENSSATFFQTAAEVSEYL
ncbi:MAG: UDP-N-acetylmuramoyl-tripeptide--D-alanyl-D-alanine ligase, partial [Bacteroidota bacterium]